MSHKHLPWRPTTAAKPTHLTSASSPIAASPQSLAALQGAASAFASRPITTPSAVKQLRNQYEVAASVGQPEKQRGRSPGHTNTAPPVVDIVQRSPSRGRHLSPEHAHLAGARSAVSSSTSPVPAPLDRTPSMIAARLVSASPSPVRESGSVSPPKQSNLSSEINRSDVTRTNAPKTISRPVAPSPRPSQINTQLTKSSTSGPNVDFDHLPRLVPTSAVTIPGQQPLQSSTTGSTPRATHEKPPAPAPRMIRTMSDRPRPTSEHRHAQPGNLVHPRPMRPKPPAPAPRNRRDVAGSPLQQSPITAQQLQGLSREEMINRMADAMVASSLASARTPSPGKAAKHHGSLRRSASAHHLHRRPTIDEAKVPSLPKPPRPMKQTLRKSSPDDEDDNVEITKRGRRHLMRKHPNMHHEGDRKRWRDRVTEAERKRYEGVFAANRGLLLKPIDNKTSPSRLFDATSECNQVVNVIARDIWERSRLPAQALEQIYDLVAPVETLYLNREQFVVGLWLIDQKLKGRKLPVRVSESVWASVRHSQGIRVSSKTMQ